MTVRMLAGLAVALLVVVCGRVVAVAKPAAQYQPPTSTVIPETRELFLDASGMVALQRHAQVDMILDGRDTAMPLASVVRLPVNAVAVTFAAGTR